MMLPLQKILNKYNVHPKGVISVGSHFAEEHEDFIKCGIERFVYIEPCANAFLEMVQKIIPYPPKDAGLYHNRYSYRREKPFLDVLFMKTACGDNCSQQTMYVSHQNQGQSNSLLKPNLHTQQHPEIIFDDAEIVDVCTLDSLKLNKEYYDFLYMDVQGAEGLVLKGAEETLKHINIIYTEVNRGQTYSGNMEINEMDAYLGERGFERVETHWPSPNWSWGDACYVLKK